MQEVVGSTPIFSTEFLKRALMSPFLFMLFYVYIIYSPSLDRYYIGHSQNLEDRLIRHNNSGSKSTKKANDWKIVYYKSFLTRSEAVQKEIQIKKNKSRKYIEWLIQSCG